MGNQEGWNRGSRGLRRGSGGVPYEWCKGLCREPARDDESHTVCVCVQYWCVCVSAYVEDHSVAAQVIALAQNFEENGAYWQVHRI